MEEMDGNEEMEEINRMEKIENMFGLDEIEEILEKEEKKEKKRKTKVCIHCLKKIKKKQYSLHLAQKHFLNANEIPKRRVISHFFIKNTEKIIKHLEEIKKILTLISQIKLKVQKKNK